MPAGLLSFPENDESVSNVGRPSTSTESMNHFHSFIQLHAFAFSTACQANITHICFPLYRSIIYRRMQKGHPYSFGHFDEHWT